MTKPAPARWAMRAGLALSCAFAGLQWAIPSAVAEEAQPKKYYFKAGVTPARYEADFADCIEVVKKTRFDTPPAPYQPGLAGAAASGFVQGMARGRMKVEALKTCLEKQKGYKLVPMTKQQLVVWNKLDREGRRKAQRILAGGGNIASLASN